MAFAAAPHAARALDGGCVHSAVATAISPDGAWIADVDEALCEHGPMFTVIVATVRLRSRSSNGPGTDVLGVDTRGHDSQRPRLAWMAPGALQVTVPTLSLLKVLTRRVGPLSIGLRFDPPDPAARAAWLRSLKLPPD